jgi:hypothetical protein
MQYLFEVSDTVLANFELDTWLLARASLFLFMQKDKCHVSDIVENGTGNSRWSR